VVWFRRIEISAGVYRHVLYAKETARANRMCRNFYYLRDTDVADACRLRGQPVVTFIRGIVMKIENGKPVFEEPTFEVAVDLLP
jgi:hypothetical protein